MHWQIDDSKPIHTQIVDELIGRILNGTYKFGERIPSVRDLALEAKVNPNTMQKALTELEDKNFITTKRTSGKYVTAPKNLIKKTKQKLSDELIHRFVEEMKKLDYETDEIITKIRKEIEK